MKIDFPDPAVRKYARANGANVVRATADQPEVLYQIHDLKNWEVREAAINAGIDVGQKHVGTRQGLGEAQVSRQELLDQMIAQGIKPEEIVNLAKQPIKTVPTAELQVGDTFVDRAGEPRRIVEITKSGKIRTADGTALTYQGGIEIRGELNSTRAQLARGGKFIEEPEREAPATFTGDEISTRVPRAKAAEQNPHTQPLFVDMDQVYGAPGLADKLAKTVSKYPGMRRVMAGITDTEGKLNAYIDFLADNLKWLYNKMPEDVRGWSRQWYDTAHADTRVTAEQNGVSHAQSAGVTAANSPQKDWDINRSLAQRIIDINAKQQNTVTTPEMITRMQELEKIDSLNDVKAGIDKIVDQGLKLDMETAKEARALGREGKRNAAFNLLNRETGAGLKTPASYWKPMQKALAGKTLGELPVEFQAPWVRAFDEAHHPGSYELMAPDGSIVGQALKKDGTPKSIAWRSMNTIEKSLNILKDGSRENISRQLGDDHKVRSFYNNIISPNSENPHLTVDTHAVAAARLSPFSQKHIEVDHNFGGAPSSDVTGSRGTYPLIAEAYKRAAQDLGLLPRELQSITWEQIRSLFPKEFRRPQNVRAVENIWKSFDRKNITLNQARNAIVKLAGGFREPGWVSRLRGE